jgi:hypothetical protein
MAEITVRAPQTRGFCQPGLAEPCSAIPSALESVPLAFRTYREILEKSIFPLNLPICDQSDDTALSLIAEPSSYDRPSIQAALRSAGGTPAMRPAFPARYRARLRFRNRVRRCSAGS